MSEETALKPLSRLQKWVIAVALVSMGFGMTISFVVAPPLARDAGLTELEVAGVLTGSSFLFAMMTPVWGRLSGQFGRKRIMLFALIASAMTNTLFIFALSSAMQGLFIGLQAFFLLAVARASFGLLASGLQPSAFAAMTDATTAKDRASGLGFLGAAMSVGSILGPTGAFILARFGALAPLWGSVVVALVCATFVFFVLPWDHQHLETTNRPKPLSMWDHRVRVFVIFMICYFTAVACMQQTLAWFIMDRYGLGRQDAVASTGLIFGIMSVAMVLVQTFYVSRYKPRPTMMLPRGIILVAAGYAFAIIHLPFWALCLGFAVVGVGSALVVPALNAMGTLAVQQHEQGGAAGLMAMAPPAGFVIGPLLGGALYMFHHDLPLMISAVSMSALLIYALVRMREEPNAAA